MRASQELRKKSCAVKTSGCRAGGFEMRALRSAGTTVSNRLFASKSPTPVVLRSKITEPFQVSELGYWPNLASASRLECQPTDTPEPGNVRCTNLSKDEP